MCGIIAIVAPDQDFPEDVLIAMRDRMIHRGPDGAGACIEKTPQGSIALGHRRLSIIDLSTAAAQPMVSHDKRYLLVFNGEIYNYLEIREELKVLGCQFRTESDTEVLLLAYAQWGKDCLRHFNGMFSFALWDHQENKLFVARDRFGEKPLYYTMLPQGGIAFSSEIKAFFAHPDILPVPNQQKIDLFLGTGRNSYSDLDTFFVGVHRFPAAHAAVFDAAGQEIERWRYWTPDYDNVDRHIKMGDAVEEFSSLLVNSVKMRMRTDVHVGACLSGGLDSSTIVGIIAKLEKNGSALFSNTYSARFDDDPTMSEGRYIDLMQHHTGLEAESVSPDPHRMAEESERLHWHQEQPFLSSSMYLEWCVTRRARETGTVVMLDGQGADEILAGYQYHLRDYQYDQFSSGHWIDLYNNTSKFNRRISAEIQKYEDGARRINTQVAYNVRNFPLLLGVTARNILADKDKIYPHKPGLPQALPSNTLHYKLARGLLYDTLPSNLHSADCNGMAHSIETRFPFLDYKLVDWVVKLPKHAYIHDGWMKYILRRVATSFVPNEISWRVDKVGFAAPQDSWLRKSIHAWAEENLFDGPVTKQPFYNRMMIEELWHEHKAGLANHSEILWRYITLNQWLRLFDSGIWRHGLKPDLTKRGNIANRLSA